MNDAVLPLGWRQTSIGAETEERKERVGLHVDPPVVLSSTKHHGLVPSDDFFRNRTVYSDDLSNYKSVSRNWFAYATNHLAEGSIGLQDCFSSACVSPIYTVFSCREGLDPKYLYRVLKTPELTSQYKLREQASVDRRGAVRYRDFAEIPLTIPSIVEQRKIVEVLDTIDEVIRSTAQLIAKQKILKVQLARDLFTGRTRCEGAAKLRQSHPLSSWRFGRLPDVDAIPEDWRLVRLVEYAKLESGHTPSRDVPDYWNGDIPWLSLHDASRLDQHVINDTRYLVTMQGINNSSARLLPEGTVAFSRTASVGKCVILGRAMATSQDFACYICGPQVINRYLLHLFRFMTNVWRLLASGSTHQTVYMPIFESLQILLPPVVEQIQIADALDAFDSALDSMTLTQRKYETIKQGMTTDLLTGRVRVGSHRD
jgi:type I restriction enzyme S subunit